MIRGETIFLGVMALVLAVAALVTTERPVRILATSFAASALAAGPGTSIDRRVGLRLAVVAVLVGLLFWWLQRGTG